MKKHPETHRSTVLKNAGRLILLTASFMIGAQVAGIAAEPPVSTGFFDVGVVVGFVLIAVGDILALG
ncbi:hypothetical protein NGM99_21400 [Mesorhizobium sp. RP14(2022)]|uniref:Uncharacterized protein n=1 Tax=Mesorhizobium liriopis TaxID=2953882 RepID=A0ABT1CC04_9HYPH|nr:hypothetical protein [Mesorhizobium liriopis]MCO6052349.1 hypothetical protein [Mesorhizobium liriopis]